MGGLGQQGGSRCGRLIWPDACWACLDRWWGGASWWPPGPWGRGAFAQPSVPVELLLVASEAPVPWAPLGLSPGMQVVAPGRERGEHRLKRGRKHCPDASCRLVQWTPDPRLPGLWRPQPYPGPSPPSPALVGQAGPATRDRGPAFSLSIPGTALPTLSACWELPSAAGMPSPSPRSWAWNCRSPCCSSPGRRAGHEGRAHVTCLTWPPALGVAGILGPAHGPGVCPSPRTVRTTRLVENKHSPCPAH